MIILDYQDRRPIYEQVVEKIQLLIVRGVLAPDSQLPSVRKLAMELSINPNTIQRAYAELEQQGFIYPVKGRGNLVSPNAELIQRQKELYYRDLKKILGIDPLQVTILRCGAFAACRERYGEPPRMNPSPHEMENLLSSQGFCERRGS